MDDTESFDSASRLGELTAKLAELPGAVVPPSLAAALAAFEASMVMPHRLRQALQQHEANAALALLPLAAAVDGPFTRELRERAAALADAPRRTHQAEAIAAVRELLADRPLRQVVAAEMRRPAEERKRITAALAGSAEPQEIECRDYVARALQPAPANAAPAVHLLPQAPAPAPAPCAPPAAVEWSDKRIAQRLDQLKTETPKRAAPMRDLLAEMGVENDKAEAARRRVQRIVGSFKPAAAGPVSSVFDLAGRPKRRVR